MIYLQSITRRAWNTALEVGFAFSPPVIQSLDVIEFKTAVTFIVGENGSGKSTLDGLPRSEYPQL